jgi:phenylacetate-coenzyme A ligase PaaK-like adenylate-forming protein
MTTLAGSRSPDDDRWTLVRGAIARARRSPFYAGHLADLRVDQPADFAKLPCTRKEHLAAASPLGMLAVPPAEAWHYHESSGTTGTPISTWCGLTELAQMATTIVTMVPELRAPETVVLNRFPSFSPVHFLLEDVLRRTGRCHIAVGSTSWDVPFERALDLMRRLPVTVLATLPLETVILREAARHLGIDRARDLGGLRAVVLGGAVLPPAFRRAIEADWGARVVELYGSNETMMLGIGCPQGRLHLATDLVEVEVLDPATLTPVAPGTAGLLTITSLVHEVMPLVRYVTGDLVEVDAVPCTCGVPTPTARVLGRAAEVPVIAGRQVTPYALLDACYELLAEVGGGIFFTVILRRGIEVLVEAPGGRPTAAAVAEARLSERLGVPVHVQYLGVGDVLDRSALFRAPKIYKPSQVSDWRAGGRKAITLMEALLEWPKFDLRTLGGIVRREVRNARRRRRLAASDR